MSETKATTLSQFLAENPITDLTDKVFISERFQKLGFAFTIRAMSGEEFNTYQQQATAVGRHRKVTFDNKLFNELVVINHTVEPNFKDATAIKAAGCTSPEQYMYSRLLAGEIIELANRISSLSGFDEDIEELKKDVKNS